MKPSDRQLLFDLRKALLHLHKTLLDEARHAYEILHGPVGSSHELFQLVLHHEDFAWLRTLSAMVASIDAALDETEGPLSDVEVEAFFRQTHALLRSGGSSTFETRYRRALQHSADVVMAHAAVIKLFPAPSAGRSGP
jgi:hypothetical protein